MRQKNAQEILDRYRNGVATDAEKKLVEYWYSDQTNHKPDLSDTEIKNVQDDLFIKLPIHEPKIVRVWPRLAAAAVILLVIGVSSYLLLKPGNTDKLTAQVQQEQIAPKQNGVTLTLTNGKSIVIDQKHHGKIVTDNGEEVNQSGSSLDYEGLHNNNKATQTLTNNSGSKFSLTLADGSEVYLDAQSSITYPAAFTSKERQVSIIGQAYFKVKHLAGRPFLVTVKDQSIEDIGTEFNINAYDATVRTTLVQGAVKINRSLLLHPGEQAVGTDMDLKAVPADLEAVTAWLQGKMVFHHAPLEDVMSKVARIYDVQVIWQDQELKSHAFGGSLNTTKKLNTVLNYLRRTQEVDFAVDGRTVRIFKPK